MEAKKKSKAMLFTAVGLLFLDVPAMLNEYYNVPHFVRGFGAGLGITLVTFGFVQFVRQRRAEKRLAGSQPAE